MTKTRNTSVVAQFSEGSSSGAEAGIAIREDRNLSTTIGITHLKVYPKLPDMFLVTAGSYANKGNKEEEAQTALAFNLSKETAMPIYGARDVKIKPQGNAYDELGKSISVSYHHDPIKGAIIASKACYAVVLVSYIAPYTLLEYTFTGSCPTTPVPNPSGLNEYDGYYTAALAVAVDTKRDKRASLQLKPPQCGSGVDMALSIEVNKTILPKLVMEPHDGIGVQLTSDLPSIAAGGLVRLYPAGTGAQIEATHGRIDRKYTEATLDIRENVVFNGETSKSLTYPPINKAGSIGETITVVNAVGNTITVALATAGETVIMASFDNNGAYSVVGKRVVENDEVVPVNSFGVAIPVWGIAKVGYTTSYEVVRYTPEASKSKSRIFESAMITARKDNRATTYKVDPPPIGGRLNKRAKLKRG